VDSAAPFIAPERPAIGSHPAAVAPPDPDPGADTEK